MTISLGNFSFEDPVKVSRFFKIHFTSLHTNNLLKVGSLSVWKPVEPTDDIKLIITLKSRSTDKLKYNFSKLAPCLAGMRIFQKAPSIPPYLLLANFWYNLTSFQLNTPVWLQWFIKSILKSMVILAIWLALSSAIYSRYITAVISATIYTVSQVTIFPNRKRNVWEKCTAITKAPLQWPVKNFGNPQNSLVHRLPLFLICFYKMTVETVLWISLMKARRMKLNGKLCLPLECNASSLTPCPHSITY